MKLWETSDNLQRDAAIAQLVEDFTVGRDHILDRELLYWDVLGSIAHASMLVKIGVLEDGEFRALKGALLNLLREETEGNFSIRREDEDSHTAIENYLIMKLGEPGKKIHTGRSRNDQVLTALKLYMKHALLQVQKFALDLASSLIVTGRKHPYAMPGYSHQQKAMPTTFSHWAEAMVESLLCDGEYLGSVFELLDSSPLGSAAGFGVSLPLDREYCAELLGFSRVQHNTLHVQNMRGKNEYLVLSALAFLMLDLNKLAGDLIYFSLPETGYLRVGDAFCTGSSIMPQKRNPDVLELVRGKAKTVQSLAMQVMLICSDLPSGYNRDFQLTKEPLLEGAAITQSSLKLMTALVNSLIVDKEKCEEAVSAEMLATDQACSFVSQGLAFRDAYKKVKAGMDTHKSGDVWHSLSSKCASGMPGDLSLSIPAELLSRIQAVNEEKSAAFEKTQLDLVACQHLSGIEAVGAIS